MLGIFPMDMAHIAADCSLEALVDWCFNRVELDVLFVAHRSSALGTVQRSALKSHNATRRNATPAAPMKFQIRSPHTTMSHTTLSI